MPPRPNAKPAFTHFLCIPLITPASRSQVSRSLASFKADVTDATSFDIPETAVRPLGTLHLTLGMLSLPSYESVQKATAVLRGLNPPAAFADIKSLSTTAPLATPAPPADTSVDQFPFLTLRGLHSMQRPEQASVLYAAPEDDRGILLRFCERLRDSFIDAGVMVREERPLLLHATIINTIYVKGGRDAQAKRGKKLTLDATDVLARYEGYVWMEGVPLERIAICKMGAKAVDGEDGAAYDVEAEVDF
ncbi:hypothetical protein D7B24_005669 [Verticillium nonalfalfae]|uniref:A-kinase anchor protein 7-like phosphoesterase domain-containing protein n=1 Tax=Verticillium nonalfalfae TaxID=1051616 RepID=A0A3M9YDS5_9PEZI|nr:uncharacterized protein D7B24_005669 [Verticillium nonalfalfae]RNJ57728.1 hypothetical protein D7B24_005669 [Verticillium nonalfalfae]